MPSQLQSMPSQLQSMPSQLQSMPSQLQSMPSQLQSDAESAIFDGEVSRLGCSVRTALPPAAYPGYPPVSESSDQPGTPGHYYRAFNH